MRKKVSTLMPLVVCLLHASLPAGAAAPEPPPPLRYFLGKDVVVTQVTSTTKVTRAIATLKGANRDKCVTKHSGDPDPELCLTETTATTREGTVGTKFVVDPKLAGPLGGPGKAFTDDAVTVELRDGMQLQSINMQSTGRAGEVIGSIAKFAGVIFGALPGLAAQQPGISQSPMAVSGCFPFAPPLTDQTDAVRLWLWENQTECKQWMDIAALQESRDKLQDDRASIEHAIRGATRPELQLLLDKLPPIDEAIKKKEAALKKRQDAFNAQLEAFTASLKLGTVSTTTTYDQVLDLSDLPAPNTLAPGMSSADAGQLASQFPEASKELWKQASLIVTLDPIVPAKCEPEPSIPAISGKENNDKMNIYFRQGTPARMRVFLADDTVEPAKRVLRTVGDRFDNFVHNCAPVSAMSFSRSVWSKRELTMTFDDRGRPLKVVRTSASDAAAIAASVAGAATALRDELATTAAKTVEIQANRRKIAMDDLSRRIDRASAEKQLSDAQLALDTANTNFDATLRQKQAAANLDALKAELALATAEASSEQMQAIELLKIEISRLGQELELVKAQQALQKATK